MIKNVMKQDKGVTMVALIVTIITLIILTSMLVYNVKDSVYIKAFTNLYNDVELLREKVTEYYEEYGQIPVGTPEKIKYTNISQLSNSGILSKKEEEGDFYVIDIEAMKGITLNYGKDYDRVKNDIQNANNYTDIYIISENSHNIFYVKGISIKENNTTKIYYTDYTEPDETTVDLRYIDGILIPDEYYYIGKEKDSSGNESIIISKNKDEKVNSTSETQYIWQKQMNLDEESLQNKSIELLESQDKNEFLKSVNHYKGYFQNKNKITDIDVIYLPIEENKWSEVYTENQKYIDKNGDIAYIPKGFRVSLAEGSNEIRSGLVITDEIEGNKSIGNEFVWIPVDNFEEFIREDFGKQAIQKIDESNFITTELIAEKYYEPSGDGEKINENASESIQEMQNMYKSVKQYKGFYIGRYETGIEENIARTSTSDISQIPVVKKNKIIYNYIKWGNSMTDEKGGAVEKARSMYNNEDNSLDGIDATLCYGVQWDAIMRWINKDISLRYIFGNDEDNGYKDKGNYDTSGNLIKTGSHEVYQIKNIYDILGNVSEWTMESYDMTGKVLRGGKSGSEESIAYREAKNVNSPNSELGLCGFRVALYIK